MEDEGEGGRVRAQAMRGNAGCGDLTCTNNSTSSWCSPCPHDTKDALLVDQPGCGCGAGAAEDTPKA